ncbi:RNA polymerase sigma factor SigE [Cellulomonas sp. ATA003]|uniref:RNA polymerase sigma factor SigE n=1 Tax=Cellulomonas sp. ATA003 TaxID=3073064 RepID=UPI0037C1A33E
MVIGSRDSAPSAAPSAVTTDGPQSPAEPWIPPSWEDIVRDHSARVYRLAFRLTGNKHDAEDLTQEVFVRVFRSLSSYTPGTFEGWLHRITTNLFLDGVRRRQRIRIDAIGDDSERHVATGELHTPERGFEHANLDLDVQRALGDLSPEYRAAVVLCDIEGLSYEEIAVTLGIKLGTVRSRIHRARSQLRRSLAHRAPHALLAAASAAGADGPDAPGQPADDARLGLVRP